MSLSTLLVVCLATGSSAAAAKSGALRRQPTEQEEASTAVVTADSSDIKLFSSLQVLLKDQDTDPASPKAKVQKKLVALIWLERVLQQNINSMDEATYEDKIKKNEKELARDTSPATAAMLGQMRTELHEFSVPFYQKAVQDEMQRLRTRQKVLLDQLIALDAKGAEEQDADADSQELEKPAPATLEVEEKKKKAQKKEKAAPKPKKEDDGSETLLYIMIGLVTLLSLSVCTIGCVVKNHVRSH